MAEPQDRLFLIVDPDTGHMIGMCSGPEDGGRCRHSETGKLPCEGKRVIPLRGTVANGLPFTVHTFEPGKCGLAWLDESDVESPLRYTAGPHPTELTAQDER